MHTAIEQKLKFFENKDILAMSSIVTDNSNNIKLEAITLDEITRSNGLKNRRDKNRCRRFRI